VTYVTAGFPTVEATAGLMLAMEAGGSGMIDSFKSPNCDS